MNYRVKRIAFLGAKSIGLECLKILCDRQGIGRYVVSALFTNLGRDITANQQLITFASEHNISIYEGIDSILELPEFDYIISVQYHVILKTQHIARAKELAFNLHIAPLPEYRGCNQFSKAIIDNKREFGCTLHKMDEGIDSGDIISETRFPIPEHCFVEELVTMSNRYALQLFHDNIDAILKNEYTLIAQADLIPIRGTQTIYRKDIDNMKCIDMAWEKEKIERHLRATLMPGFLPPFFMLNGHKINCVID
jgi:methionyl-tRNA formyltransferase